MLKREQVDNPELRNLKFRIFCNRKTIDFFEVRLTIYGILKEATWRTKSGELERASGVLGQDRTSVGLLRQATTEQHIS